MRGEATCLSVELEGKVTEPDKQGKGHHLEEGQNNLETGR